MAEQKRREQELRDFKEQKKRDEIEALLEMERAKQEMER